MDVCLLTFQPGTFSLMIYLTEIWHHTLTILSTNFEKVSLATNVLGWQGSRREYITTKRHRSY